MFSLSWPAGAEGWQSILLFLTVIGVAATFTIGIINAALNRHINSVKKEEGRVKDEKIALEFKAKDVLIANANKRAEEAKAEAAKANEGAGLANERAQKLEQENIGLRTDLENAVAEARHKATELALAQQKTAEAQKEAAQTLLGAQKYLQQIRSFQTPRRLVPGHNRDDFLRALKGRPMGELDITWASDLFIGEPQIFAEDIAEAVTEAGWSKPKISGAFVSDGDDNPLRVKVTAGLRIIVRDPNKIPPAALSLHSAIFAAGFIVEVVPNDKIEDGIVKLMVLMIPPDGGWILRLKPQ